MLFFAKYFLYLMMFLILKYGRLKMNRFIPKASFILTISIFLSACSSSTFNTDALALNCNTSYTTCGPNIKQSEKEDIVVQLVENQSITKKENAVVQLVENQSITKQVDELPLVIPEVSPLMFEFDQSNAIQSDLSDTIQFLLDNKQFTAVLHGYTDQLGSESYNLKLSSRRAKSIEKILIGAGVSHNQISIIAHGESSPNVPAINLNSGQTKAEVISYYSPNRRVEISFDLNSFIAQSN